MVFLYYVAFNNLCDTKHPLFIKNLKRILENIYITYLHNQFTLDTYMMVNHVILL